MKFIFFLLFLSLPAAAQHRATVGFWNVENMFDTIPAPEYPDDDDYCPGGKQRWNTERYVNKHRNIARILDEMNLDVVGLAEVENEAVTRDLVRKLKTDYNYIHRTAGARPRGRDVVLLYKGDRFIPREVRTVDSRTSRSFLYVRGVLRGHRVDIVVCHMPSMLNRHDYRDRAAKRLCTFVDSLHTADPAARVIVMGDFNATPRDRVTRQNISDSLFCPLESAAARGHGTYAHNNRWMMYDNIYLGMRLLGEFERAEIYIKPHLLYNDPGLKRHGYPHRTFTNGRYTNGFSDHLPVFTVFFL
jgi:endonuclease/exonuclease/phosphatase family metal-dependent hydrolase